MTEFDGHFKNLHFATPEYGVDQHVVVDALCQLAAREHHGDHRTPAVAME